MRNLVPILVEKDASCAKTCRLSYEEVKLVQRSKSRIAKQGQDRTGLAPQNGYISPIVEEAPVYRLKQKVA